MYKKVGILLALVGLSTLIGVAFDSQLSFMAPLGMPLLGLVMLVTLIAAPLTLTKNDVRYSWKAWAILLAQKVILFPVAAYYMGAWMSSAEVGFAMMLCFGTATAVTSVFYVILFGGDGLTAYVLTLASSLLAPFSLPVTGLLLAGRAVEVPAKEIFVTLFLTLVVPSLVALPIVRKLKAVTQLVRRVAYPLQLALFFLLVLAIVVNAGNHLLDWSPLHTRTALICTTIFVVLNVANYALTFALRLEPISAIGCACWLNFFVPILIALHIKDEVLLVASAWYFVLFHLAIPFVPYLARLLKARSLVPQQFLGSEAES